ncbi:MAG: FAD:protein FMN transferase [Gemmatimonadota bacterium]|nr:MAG: FAD:protein FMN transferase [Gemmatimonadota bacterium]
MIDPERSRCSLPSRRQFIALGIGALAVVATPRLFRRRRELVRRAVPVMGTIADIAVVHRDERYAQTAIDAAIAELRHVDATMTRFSDSSEVGLANLKAGAEPVVVSRGTALVLEEALRWAEASDGAFDPCLGRAMALWDVGRRAEPPPADQVGELAGRRLYRSLELGELAGGPAVLIADPDAAIDLGGIAKGYGVDRAVEALRSYGIFNGLVNVGGDLYALGVSEDGDPWKVGIRDPDDPDGLVGTVEVSDRAVATSGDYIQYFQHAGRRYHHMLDPATGEPRRATMRSVTVMADDCVSADAAGTAIFGMPVAQASRLLEVRARGARVVHSV